MAVSGSQLYAGASPTLIRAISTAAFEMTKSPKITNLFFNGSIRVRIKGSLGVLLKS